VTGGAVGADQTVVETAAGRIRGEAAGDLLVWRAPLPAAAASQAVVGRQGGD
jgi:hypothetical protein